MGMESFLGNMKGKAKEVFHKAERGAVMGATILSIIVGVSEQTFAQGEKGVVDPTHGFDMGRAYKDFKNIYPTLQPGSVVVAPGDTITYTIKPAKDDSTKLAYVFTETKEVAGKHTLVGVHEYVKEGSQPEGKFDKMKTVVDGNKIYYYPKTSPDIVYGKDSDGKPATLSISRLGLYKYHTMFSKYAELSAKQSEPAVAQAAPASVEQATAQGKTPSQSPEVPTQ